MGLGLVTIYGMDLQVEWSLNGLSFSIYYTLCHHIAFRQEQFCVDIFEIGGGWWSHFLGAVPNLWIWSLHVLFSFILLT